MFDTKIVGKKIAKLRKENNLTQLELADTLGVSYQAVSNWERGNSMPDISKLQELSSILNCSIEELLNHTKEGKMVEEISKGNGLEYIKDNNINIIEYSDVAPVIKPKDNEEFLSHILKEQKEKVTIQDLISIAPFVDEDIFRSYIDDLDMDDIEELIGLAPFLSDELLREIVEKFLKVNKVKDINKLVGLAPFLDDDTLTLIIDKFLEEGNVTDINKIVGLAPFLNEEVMERILDNYLEHGGTYSGSITGLYPFLGEEAVAKLAKSIAYTTGLKHLVSMAPFLEEEQLDKIIEEWLEKSGDNINIHDVMGLLPFLQDDTLHRLSKVLVDKCGISALKYIAPFL